MRGKNRKTIASYLKLPQFTTMNVIDGQASLKIIYSSLIFYSLTIDNILNIIVLLILAGVTVITLTGENGLLTKLSKAQEDQKIAEAREEIELALQALVIDERTAVPALSNEQRAGIVQANLKTESTVEVGEGKGFNITHRGYEFKVDENYKVTYKGSSEFDAAAWDAKALPESYFYWGSDDERDPYYNLIYGFNPPEGEIITELILPSRCKAIGNDSFYENSTITSVIIPETTTTIKNSAFMNCTNLSEIELPDSITEFGTNVFEGTAWYNSQPNGEVVYIGKIAYEFKGEIPGNTTIELKADTKVIAGHAFNSQWRLTSINIPNSVITIGHDAFRYCENLINIEIPDSVITIGPSAFHYCHSLKNVELSENLEEINSYTFYECNVLEEIKIGNKVKNIYDEAFGNCTSLAKVELGNSVTDIYGNAFHNCTSLTKITIPNSVTRIAYGAFENCTSLAEIAIANTSAYIDSYAFNNTAWYNNLEDNSVIYLSDLVFGYKGEMPINTSIELKEGTTAIGPNAFAYKEGLTDITIPNSVTSIGEYAFEGTGLTNITIPSGVTTIERYTFRNCYSLVTVQLPDTITKIEAEAFRDCSSLSAIELPDNLITIGSTAFQRCSSLETMEIPDKVTLIDTCAFSDCSNLTSFSLSKSVKCIGINAFEGCSKLNSIIIWKNVDEVRSRAFRAWGSTQTIHIEAEEIPEGWHPEWNGDCEAQVVPASTGN